MILIFRNIPENTKGNLMKKSKARERLKLPAVSGRPHEGLVAAEHQAKKIREILEKLQFRERDGSRLEAISRMKNWAELVEDLACFGKSQPRFEAAEIEEMLDRLLWEFANMLGAFCSCELGCPG
jgi:hypothetical protein